MSTNKIKIEPGTSRLANMIRFEEGRLPSLVSRNLKLGSCNLKAFTCTGQFLFLTGSKPKVFKPNLVERKKKNEVQAEVQENHRGRGRNHRGGDRGRGSNRGRGGHNFIQSQGVFSEGMSEGQKRASMYSDRAHSSNKDADVAKMMDKPVLQKNANYKVFFRVLFFRRV